MAGLDPAIHHFSRTMDTRVKPAYDDRVFCDTSCNNRRQGLWVAAFAGTTTDEPQNVGNEPAHLLRLPAIRATLRSPRGFDQIQL